MKNIIAIAAASVFCAAVLYSLPAGAQDSVNKKEYKLQSVRSHSPKSDDIQLNCNDPKKTLSKLLAKLNPEKAHTIHISGACHDNVSIVDFQHLILIAEPGASITDASGATLAVVDVEFTTSFEMIGFTIEGAGAPGVICGSNSTCFFGDNTIQNTDEAILVFESKLISINDIVQNNGVGFRVIKGSTASITNVSILNNEAFGAFVGYNSTLNAEASTVRGNGANGIRATGSSVLRLEGNIISDNGSDGVFAQIVSAAYFLNGNTVTNNGNAGVRVKDLSMAVFLGDDVTGNLGGTDVLCEPQAPQTRGTGDSINGGTSNCVETGTPG
jgi:hypothetical protein